MQVHTLGINLAKTVFQVHGVDESDEVVLVRQVRRQQAGTLSLGDHERRQNLSTAYPHRDVVGISEENTMNSDRINLPPCSTLSGPSLRRSEGGQS